MKKTIKIRRKVLKESLDEATMPPRGKVSGSPKPEDTEAYKGDGEFASRVEVPYKTSSGAPTYKATAEDFATAFADDIKDQGVMSKLWNYIKEKFISTEEEPAPTPEPEVSAEPPPAKKMMPPLDMEPANLTPAGDEQAQLPFDDVEISPRSWEDQFIKDKEDLGDGFSDLMQEIKKRHFK